MRWRYDSPKKLIMEIPYIKKNTSLYWDGLGINYVRRILADEHRIHCCTSHQALFFPKVVSIAKDKVFNGSFPYINIFILLGTDPPDSSNTLGSGKMVICCRRFQESFIFCVKFPGVCFKRVSWQLKYVSNGEGMMLFSQISKIYFVINDKSTSVYIIDMCQLTKTLFSKSRLTLPCPLMFGYVTGSERSGLPGPSFTNIV